MLKNAATSRALKGRKVIVIEKLNLKMSVEYKGENVKFTKIDINRRNAEFERVKSEKVVRRAKRSAHKPAKNHPWITGDSWQAVI